MTLLDCKEGSEVTVVSILGGRGLQRRLAGMGLTVNSRITVLRAGAGPRLIEVRGSRLGIGRGISGRIAVAPFYPEVRGV